MHLYALDEKESWISVYQADRQTSYFCRECGSIVKCRGGFLRQMHFYHLEPNRSCRQSGKSIVHLQIQHHLQKILQDCELEKHFPAVNRIADVVWEKEKMVFEIQCSPITAREIEERNRNYHSIGYQVVWILHDRLYNKNRLTAAEYFLQESPHYFTNINSDGVGRVYDQWDVVEKGRRRKKGVFREVNLSSHQVCQQKLFLQKEYPKWVLKRIQAWPVYFSGDYLDYLVTSEEGERNALLVETTHHEQEVLLQEKQAVTPKGIWGTIKKWLGFMAFPYRLTLYLILDKLK
jgi:competence protein CoiA